MGPRCSILYLNSSVMLHKYLQQTTLADDMFRCFFLGALRVNIKHFDKLCMSELFLYECISVHDQISNLSTRESI